jgi:transposase
MALSVDLRERVLRAHERSEGSQRVPAERFGVGLGTVNGWLRLAREEGRRAPLPSRGGPKPLGGADPALLAGLVAERNDATLAEYAAMLAERTAGRRFSASVLCRALARLGLARKKRRSGPRSRTAPTSPPRARRGGRRSPRRSARSASSSSMSAASTRG